jgi:hypothetical protein
MSKRYSTVAEMLLALGWTSPAHPLDIWRPPAGSKLSETWEKDLFDKGKQYGKDGKSDDQ